MAAGHVRRSPSLVDEHEALGFQIQLTGEPGPALPQDVGAVLLDRVPGLFFLRDAVADEEARCSVPIPTARFGDRLPMLQRELPPADRARNADSETASRGSATQAAVNRSNNPCPEGPVKEIAPSILASCTSTDSESHLARNGNPHRFSSCGNRSKGEGQCDSQFDQEALTSGFVRRIPPGWTYQEHFKRRAGACRSGHESTGRG